MCVDHLDTKVDKDGEARVAVAARLVRTDSKVKCDMHVLRRRGRKLVGCAWSVEKRCKTRMSWVFRLELLACNASFTREEGW